MLARRDLFWGGLAQILNVGAGLLILPVVLRLLPAADVGLWFAFLALAGLVQLLELGFQPTIARAAAYVHAGAQDLHEEGFQHVSTGDFRPDLLADLIRASRHIYRIVALVATFVLFILGTGYVYSIVDDSAKLPQAMLAWWLIAAGSVFNFYFGYYNALLQGRGDVTGSNKAVVYSKLSFLAMAIVFLISGFGLVSIGVASLVSVVIGRMVARSIYSAGGLVMLGEPTDDPLRYKAMLKKMWPNAKKLGVTYLGAFLILRGNTLVATTFLGLEAAASYGLAIQLLQALTGVANMPLMLQMPKMNKYQIEKDTQGLIDSIGVVVFFGLLIYVLGAMFLLVLGSPLLSLVGSKTSLPASLPLLLLCVVFGLELHHSIFASYLTTFNVIPFVRAALVSGVAICLLAIFLVSLLKLGIMGLVISQGLVQLAYNNWKWPAVALRSLHVGWLKLTWHGATKFMGVIRAS